MIEYLRSLYCRHFHRRIGWPINGHYECHACLRTFPVYWHPPTRHAPAVVRPMSDLTGIERIEIQEGRA